MDQFFALGSTHLVNLISYGVVALLAVMTLVTFFVTSDKRLRITSYILGATTFFMIWLLIVNPSGAGVKVGDGKLEVNISRVTKIVVNREDVVSARILDWKEVDEYKPVLRTFGTSAGDYRIGSFKLKNGKKAKIVAVGTKVLVLELKNEDYILLLAPKDFDDFIRVVNESFIEIPF